MLRGWSSYDEVAVTYDRLAVPLLFGPIARDLVALLALPAGAAVLDVGTGTGSGALAAWKAAGTGAFVVGLDLSAGMLHLARSKGLPALARGMVPGLPFADGVFDRVLANFVLNHVTSYQGALTDMVRVLRPGGRLGVSAWGPLQNECRQLWRELAEAAAGKDALSAAVREAIPWEEWFSDPAHLRAAFEDAGLLQVTVAEREYSTRMAIADYLSMREVSMGGRFVSEFLGPAEWEVFRAAVRDAFHARFPEPIVDTLPVYLCAGTKRLHRE